MKEFLEKLDTKTITSAGGLILAGIMVFVVYQVALAKGDEIVDALNVHNVDMRDTALQDQASREKLIEVLTNNTNATINMTAAVKDLQTLIRTNRISQ